MKFKQKSYTTLERKMRRVVCHDCGTEFDTFDSTSKVYCPKCGGHRIDTLNVTTTKSRRKLFSNESERIVKEIVCSDCGTVIEKGGSTTKDYCPKCGGNRFNVISTRKERRKIFSEDSINVRLVKCHDCGTEFETAENPVSIFCPNCGGRRFDIPIKKDNQEKQDESELQRAKILDEEHEGDLEKSLKEFSGKTLNKGEFEKVFSGKTDYLFEKGYAKADGENISINPSAYNFEKLFSTITMTIIKRMDGELDPNICNGNITKEEAISRLIQHGELTPKETVLIKKAHCIDPGTPSLDWIKDSSIVEDLREEFQGSSFGIEDFIRMLRDRYPDAPEDIIDMLVRQGIVSIEDGKVTIS